MLKIVQPKSTAELDSVRLLIRSFADWARKRYAGEVEFVERYFGHGDFEAELAGLPGKYSPPRGRLLLALENNRAVGCVALRDLGSGNCEMKRLYVDVAEQGKGVGWALVASLIAEAKAAGYLKMRLDTGPGQVEAHALYRGMGFHVVAPYYDLPEELAHWLVFMELDLQRAPS
jgi:ribosomal protein S18 acetylase RimI-like enzyme